MDRDTTQIVSHRRRGAAPLARESKLPERAAGDVRSPGDELVVLVQPYNLGEDEVVDGYLAVILPNGAISFHMPSGFSASPPPWFPNVYLPNSFEIIDAPVSLGVIPEGAPEGTYPVIAGFANPAPSRPSMSSSSSRFR